MEYNNVILNQETGRLLLISDGFIFFDTGANNARKEVSRRWRWSDIQECSLKRQPPSLRFIVNNSDGIPPSPSSITFIFPNAAEIDRMHADLIDDEVLKTTKQGKEEEDIMEEKKVRDSVSTSIRDLLLHPTNRGLRRSQKNPPPALVDPAPTKAGLSRNQSKPLRLTPPVGTQTNDAEQRESAEEEPEIVVSADSLFSGRFAKKERKHQHQVRIACSKTTSLLESPPQPTAGASSGWSQKQSKREANHSMTIGDKDQVAQSLFTGRFVKKERKRQHQVRIVRSKTTSPLESTSQPTAGASSRWSQKQSKREASCSMTIGDKDQVARSLFTGRFAKKERKRQHQVRIVRSKTTSPLESPPQPSAGASRWPQKQSKREASHSMAIGDEDQVAQSLFSGRFAKKERHRRDRVQIARSATGFEPPSQPRASSRWSHKQAKREANGSMTIGDEDQVAHSLFTGRFAKKERHRPHQVGIICSATGWEPPPQSSGSRWSHKQARRVANRSIDICDEHQVALTTDDTLGQFRLGVASVEGPPLEPPEVAEDMGAPSGAALATDDTQGPALERPAQEMDESAMDPAIVDSRSPVDRPESPLSRITEVPAAVCEDEERDVGTNLPPPPREPTGRSTFYLGGRRRNTGSTPRIFGGRKQTAKHKTAAERAQVHNMAAAVLSGHSRWCHKNRVDRGIYNG